MNISIINNRGPKRACGVPGCRHVARKLVVTGERTFGLCDDCYSLFLAAAKELEKEEAVGPLCEKNENVQQKTKPNLKKKQQGEE